MLPPALAVTRSEALKLVLNNSIFLNRKITICASAIFKLQLMQLNCTFTVANYVSSVTWRNDKETLAVVGFYPHSVPIGQTCFLELEMTLYYF